MKWLVGVVALACVACAAPMQETAPVHIGIKSAATTYSLANGLEVILVEDHRTPFVALHLRYHVGSKDDPRGREGMAHLYEHMMFGGSRHIVRDDVLPSLDRLGARGYNGSTSRDNTDYYETVPAGALDATLWLEGDRMRSAADVFDEQLLAREKDVVENERKLNVETAGLGNVPALMTEAIYPPQHPYRHLPIGTTDAVRATTLDDLRAFHDRNYTPDNATLALVGDFDQARAKMLVEKYFGPVRPATTPPTPRHVPTVTAPVTKRIRIDANVSYGAVRVTFPLPARGQPGFYESWAALQLATWTIDSRAAQKKIAHGVTSRFDALRLGTLGEIRATLDPGATADAFIEIVDQVLYDLSKARHLTYLPDLRSELIGGALYAQEGLAERAAKIQFYDEAYGDANHVMTELKAVEAMSSEDIVAAYGSLLSLDRALVTVIVQNPQAPVAGQREP